MLGFSKLHSEKTKLVGRIDKVPTLVGRSREPLKRVWESGYQMKTFHYLFRIKRIVQLALQELNLSSQVNINLALPDIITNNLSVESRLPESCFLSYISKLFAMTLYLRLS